MLTFTLEQGRVRNKDFFLAVFLGAKPVIHSTKVPRVDTALGNFCKLRHSQGLDVAFLEKD